MVEQGDEGSQGKDRNGEYVSNFTHLFQIYLDLFAGKNTKKSPGILTKENSLLKLSVTLGNNMKLWIYQISLIGN